MAHYMRPIQDDIPPQHDSFVQNNTKVWIKSSYMLLNGKTMSSLSTHDNQDDWAPNDYFMFAQQTGCVNTGFSHGISIDSFMSVSNEILKTHSFEGRRGSFPKNC